MYSKSWEQKQAHVNNPNTREAKSGGSLEMMASQFVWTYMPQNQ